MVSLLARKYDFLNLCIAGNMYLVGAESVCFDPIHSVGLLERRETLFSRP